MWKIRVSRESLITILTTVAAVMLTAGGCWASQPSIFVDNVNGAPTPNASGSPEDMSPVSALATCHTNGAASTTIQWPSNGISLPAGNECNTGNTNCGILFLGTAAGRQFTEILSVAANTVVVEDSFNIAAGSPVDCAVGGRLLNVEPRLVLDMKGDHGPVTHGNDAGGWQVFIVNSGANYTWSATRVATNASDGSGFYGVRDLSNVRPIVECNFQPGSCLSLAGSDVVGIEFRNTNPTKTGTIGLLLNTLGGQIIRDVIIGGDSAATAFETGVDWNNNNRTIAGSLIRNNVVGIDLTGITDAFYTFLANVFDGNGTAITTLGNTNFPSLLVLGNIFWRNGIGLFLDDATFTGYHAIISNTFDSNTTAGVQIVEEGSILNMVFASNMLTSNSIGVEYTGPSINFERESALIDFNCYGIGPVANGSNISGFVLGPNVTNVNPQYANAAIGDFTPTSNDPTFIAWPPGLSGLTPRFYPGTMTASQPRCGAIQPSTGGGFTNVGI